MENLNAEQTKKALEWCYAEGTCGECPYQKICFEVSQWQILGDALAIINSQEQKIKELTEENERLNKEVDRLSQVVLYHDGVTEMQVEEAKADTVRKMQERLTKKVNADIDRCYALGIGVVGPLSLFIDEIDETAKEMLEGSNE